MTRVDVGDGKYAVVLHDNGAMEALRYGEPWRDLTGDKLVYCLASELQEARDALKRADKLFKVALPKFNWGASALSGEAIRLLNEVPGEVAKALK